MKKTFVVGTLAALVLSFGGLGSAFAQTGGASGGTEAQQAEQVGPFNLNTATDEELLTVPGVGDRMLREFKEGVLAQRSIRYIPRFGIA